MQFSLVGSLFVYLIVFAIATLFIYLSEISEKRITRFSCALLGILVLSFFAASRSDTIGKDIQGYVTPIFQIAKSSVSFSNFLNLGQSYSSSTSSNSKEFLYLLITYFSSKVASTDWLLLFILQFLTVTPVYIAAMNFSKKYNISITFFMLMYMFLFYLNSFNVMRQSIACAFLLLGYSYQGTNNKKMLISYILAMLFHRMAVIGIVFILIGKWIARQKGFKKIYIIIALVIVAVGLKPSITFLMQKNLLTAAQSYYANVFVFGTIDTAWTNASIILMLTDSLRYTFLMLPFFYIKRDEPKMYELKNIILVGYVIYMVVLISMRSIYGSRLSLYVNFLYLPMWAYFCKKKSSYWYFIAFVVLIVFWIAIDLVVNRYGNFMFR